MIHSVKAGSPMDGLLHPEDIVIFLDDEVRLLILSVFSLIYLVYSLTTLYNLRMSLDTTRDN